MDKVIMRTISKVKTIKQHLNNNSYLILLLSKPFIDSVDKVADKIVHWNRVCCKNRVYGNVATGILRHQKWILVLRFSIIRNKA